MAFSKRKFLLFLGEFGIHLVRNLEYRLELFSRNAVYSIALGHAVRIGIGDGENEFQEQDAHRSAGIQLDAGTDSHAAVGSLIELIRLESFVIIQESPVGNECTWLERIGETDGKATEPETQRRKHQRVKLVTAHNRRDQ